MAGAKRSYDQRILDGPGRTAARVLEDVPWCWFCAETTGKRSKEHIFPQWLLRHYGAQDERVEPVRISLPLGGVVASHRPSRPLRAHVNGEVCETCNNGWMSGLTADAGAILTRSDLSGPITATEAEILARWFAMVAVNLNVTQPYRLLVTAEDRHALATGVPDNVGVDLFTVRHQNGVVDWAQGCLAGMRVPGGVGAERMKELAELTLVTHIRVASLVGVVTALPQPLEIGPVPPGSETAKIWPLRGPLPTWDTLPVHEDYLSALSLIDLTTQTVDLG